MHRYIVTLNNLSCDWKTATKIFAYKHVVVAAVIVWNKYTESDLLFNKRTV